MGNMDRYQSAREVSRAGHIETGMSRTRGAHATDRQVEIERRWYPSGQIAGERLRIRERSFEGPVAADEEDPGCLARLVILALVAVVAGGIWSIGAYAVGAWWGGAIWVAGAVAYVRWTYR